jgi:CDP-diacylglycerol--serine O-phosphatidyltransferase
VIRHFLNPPNWFTAASIFCSTTAMALLISAGQTGAVDRAVLARACILIVFGGVFDNLDGRVARLTRRQSEFGVQLDSIADMLGFGLAPAMVAWSWKLHNLGWLGLGFAFWYVLCAAFRLARFNVNTVTHHWPLHGHSQGLTSTMSGGILVTLVWVSSGALRESYTVSNAALCAFTGLLGYLMISSIPFRNFKDVRRNPNARRLLGLSVAASLTGAIWFDDVSLFFAVGALLYVVVGLIDGLTVAALNHRLASALLMTDHADDAVDHEDDTAPESR